MKVITEESAKAIRLALYRFTRSPTNVISLIAVMALIAIAIFGEFLAPYPEDAEVVHYLNAFQPPSSTHFFGTDSAGRDVFSRVILGSRISLSGAALVIGLASIIGLSIGLLSGVAGGLVDLILMRVVDIILSIPPLVLALAVCVALSPSLTNSLLAISFAWWPSYTRIIRGEVLHLKEEGFVEAARSFGAGIFHIAFKEILPNAVTPLIVKVSLDIGYVILIQATLGFLGVGAQPPTPEWGTIISQGRAYLPESWWISITPGLFIFWTVIFFSLLGDGIRDIIVKD